jgi:hypothetical protein
MIRAENDDWISACENKSKQFFFIFFYYKYIYYTHMKQEIKMGKICICFYDYEIEGKKGFNKKNREIKK